MEAAMKKILVFAISLLLSFALFAENYGLVLSGGGAKGAYEVGVWKALDDYGITEEIKVISGSSVGALNAALFASTDTKTAEALWREEVGYSSFLMPDTSSFADVAAFAVRNAKNNLGKKSLEEDPYNLNDRLSEEDSDFVRYLLDGIYFIADTSAGFAKGTLNYIADYILSAEHSDGLFTRDALSELLGKYVTLESINKSGKEIYASALPKDGELILNAVFKFLGSDSVHYFKLNEQINSENIHSILMASSSFPLVYESTLLPADVIENGQMVGQSYEYIDGGFESVGGRNTPVAPVVANAEIDTVIIVYLKSEEELDASLSEYLIDESELNGKKKIEIIPSRNLGDLIEGTVNFEPENIEELIDLGYSDAASVLEFYGFKKLNKFQKFFKSIF